MDIVTQRREDVRRTIQGLLKLLDKADLDQLNTVFRCVNYLRACLAVGKQPREHQ